ncbi:MAG: pyridoxamine 5'-phosphate oxidase family protein [Desulfovibrio sp.]|uniref:pyridoxamine 5'-phosphate oxidase family protein n=1 Tax=Desulfovibrio sp. 7SRBS1 TaxID=3378064 RepID=UPI003B3FDB6A
MRLKQRGVFDLHEVEDMLRRGRICHLAVNDNGYPYVVPLNYAYADGCLYMHCASEGKKVECLERDRNVAFSVVLHEELVTGDNACDYTMRYESVMGRGQVVILRDVDAIREGLDVLMAAYPPCDCNYKEKYLGRMLVLKLRIQEMTGKRRAD